MGLLTWLARPLWRWPPWNRKSGHTMVFTGEVREKDGREKKEVKNSV
jgi:hypothetical protein